MCYFPIYDETFYIQNPEMLLSNFNHTEHSVICRSMLARDLQSIVLYDQEGKFVGIRRPSSKLPIDIDGVKIVIEDAIGSTGLDLKVYNSKQRISQIQAYDFCFICFFLDGSGRAYCLCWIWCSNAHNLHQLYFPFPGEFPSRSLPLSLFVGVKML